MGGGGGVLFRSPITIFKDAIINVVQVTKLVLVLEDSSAGLPVLNQVPVQVTVCQRCLFGKKASFILELVLLVTSNVATSTSLIT